MKNKYNLPKPLLAALENDPYRFDGDISTTSLILPPRIFQLRKRYHEKIHEDASDLIYRLLGQNTHHILERIDVPDCEIEQRFYAEICGWEVGGKIDLYERTTKTLSDWKVTSVWNVLNGVKPEHEQQLNVNAWLMILNDIRPEKLQIVNFLRDWSKYKAKEHSYPDCQVVVQTIKKWSIDQMKSWVEDRVKLHQSCENLSDDELPPCTAEERWARPTKYAVVKTGRKSALRLLDTQEEAEQWIEKNQKGASIEIRHGSNVRCEEYCNVSEYCSHKN